MSEIRKRQSYVSMQDVADHAKVSKSTVSKVLNNRSDVSRKAKGQVLASCEKLGYKLNPNIQDLLRKGVAGHSHDIAFILSGMEFANPSYAGMIDGISRGVEKYNLHLILSKLSGNETTIYDFPPAVRDHRVAGVLITGVLNETLISLLRGTGIPYVVIGNYPSTVTAFSNSVELHTPNLMHTVINEFKARGRNRIAIFHENPDNYYSQNCFTEYKRALAANGLPFYPELVFEGKGGDFNAFYAMEPVFSGKDLMFDAILCMNFFACQEVACRIVAHFGKEKAGSVLMATIASYSKRMLVPTLFFNEVSSEIASLGLDLLMEKMKNPEMGTKSISFTPVLLTSTDRP